MLIIAQMFIETISAIPFKLRTSPKTIYQLKNKKTTNKKQASQTKRHTTNTKLNKQSY